MPFSHHSHSGQFCDHAVDSLEQCIQAAISKGLGVFALTEHMPRNDPADLYPAEVEKNITTQDLHTIFDNYHQTALLLRKKYASKITLLIGFEIDYIRPSSISFIRTLSDKYSHDLFVGSIHHVNTFPIDYDHTLYTKAIQSLPENTEEALFEKYFDEQYTMLTELKPKIVGHFDLIRLKSSNHERSLRDWKAVWEKVERNVRFIVEYEGLVEMNSAAVRKGWTTPYPRRDVCEFMVQQGIKFTISDDSHGTEQVAYGYNVVIEYLKSLGVESIYYYDWKDIPRNMQTKRLESEIKEVALPIIGDVMLRNIKVNDIEL